MNISPNIYIGLLTALVSLAGAWAVVKYRMDRLENTDNNQWVVIDDVRKWRSRHEKEELEVRIENEKRMGDVKSNINEIRSQHIDILRRIDNMDLKLDKMFDILNKYKLSL